MESPFHKMVMVPEQIWNQINKSAVESNVLNDIENLNEKELNIINKTNLNSNDVKDQEVSIQNNKKQTKSIQNQSYAKKLIRYLSKYPKRFSFDKNTVTIFGQTLNKSLPDLLTEVYSSSSEPVSTELKIFLKLLDTCKVTKNKIGLGKNKLLFQKLKNFQIENKKLKKTLSKLKKV